MTLHISVQSKGKCYVYSLSIQTKDWHWPVRFHISKHIRNTHKLNMSRSDVLGFSVITADLRSTTGETRSEQHPSNTHQCFKQKTKTLQCVVKRFKGGKRHPILTSDRSSRLCWCQKFIWVNLTKHLQLIFHFIYMYIYF